MGDGIPADSAPKGGFIRGAQAKAQASAAAHEAQENLQKRITEIQKPHDIKKGESLWNVTKDYLNKAEINATDKNIMNKMLELAKINGYDNVEDFNNATFGKGSGTINFVPDKSEDK